MLEVNAETGSSAGRCDTMEVAIVGMGLWVVFIYRFEADTGQAVAFLGMRRAMMTSRRQAPFGISSIVRATLIPISQRTDSTSMAGIIRRSAVQAPFIRKADASSKQILANLTRRCSGLVPMRHGHWILLNVNS